MSLSVFCHNQCFILTLVGKIKAEKKAQNIFLRMYYRLILCYDKNRSLNIDLLIKLLIS